MGTVARASVTDFDVRDEPLLGGGGRKSKSLPLILQHSFQLVFDKTFLLLHNDLSTIISRVCLCIKIKDRSDVTISCFPSNIR